METTFILAQKLNVSPFEIMAQEIDAVIMVVNYYLDCNEAKNNTSESLPEKERDKDFWSAL